MGKENATTGAILVFDEPGGFSLELSGRYTIRNCGSIIEESHILMQLSERHYDFIVIPHDCSADCSASGKIEAIPEEYRLKIIVVSNLGLTSFQKDAYAKLGVTICARADNVVELVKNLLKLLKRKEKINGEA